MSEDNEFWPYTRRIGCRPAYCFGQPTFMGTRLPPWVIAYDAWNSIKADRSCLMRADWLNARRFVKDFNWFLQRHGDWRAHNFIWLRYAAEIDEWWEKHAIKQTKTCTVKDVNDAWEKDGKGRPCPETVADQEKYSEEDDAD